jgi:hypothetical protein
VFGLEFLAAYLVKGVEGLANRAIAGEQKAMGAMFLLGRGGHGAKGVIFLIHQ